MSNKQVKIMRGISGGGKSTHAKMLQNDACDHGMSPLICSADDFFIKKVNDELEYKFDIEKLGEAHQWCMRKFIRGLEDEMSPVIVDNTNIAIEDISPYVAVGQAFGYDVEIIQVNTSPDIAAGRNVHGVDSRHVYNMHKRLTSTKLPSRFKVTHINLQQGNIS